MKLLIFIATLLIYSNLFSLFGLFENGEETGLVIIDSTITTINENSFEADDEPTTLKLSNFKATKDSIYITFSFIDGYRSDYTIGSANKLDGSHLKVVPTSFTKDSWVISGAGSAEGVVLKGVGVDEKTITIEYPFQIDKTSIFNYLEILDPKVEGDNLISGDKRFTLVVKQLKDISLTIDGDIVTFNNGVATYSVDGKERLDFTIVYEEQTIIKHFKIK